MTHTKESTLVTAIREAIVDRYGEDAVVYKIHGSPVQEAGIPDLLVCLEGRFIGLEVKFQRPGESREHALDRVSEIQAHQIARLGRAGATAAAVLSIEDALEVLEEVVR